jgi:glyoxylase-like metal-dependent hydrolase (beta-lactamase superfamily II)
MNIRKVNDFIHLIDLKPMGIENYIASYVLRGEKVAIIETGPTVSIENLLGGLEKIGIKTEEVDYVAVSHVHIDHAGGAGTLIHHLPNAKLLVHKRGAPHLINPQKLWTQTKQVLREIAELYQKFEPVPKEKVIAATDGMKIDLGQSFELKVLETLGHASHHLSFYENKSNGIFSGDTAGIYLNKFDVIVPTTPAPFNLEMTLASITRLAEMKPKNLYYTHFGQVGDAVRRLETYKNRLKLWAEIILKEMKTEDKPKKIYQKILMEDPQINAIADFLQNHLIFRRGILIQNIQGFIGYFKRTSKTIVSNKTHS